MRLLERVLRIFAPLALLAIVCAACMSGPAPQAARSDEAAAAEALEDYRLGPGDRLKINVFNEADLSREFVVSPTGTIAYPLVGEFQTEGKTVAEFTQTLTTALQRYVRQPSISVEVMNYRPYYILGEVKAPKEYPYTAGLTVFNAVATAGGFTERADTRRVFIRRVNEAAERQYRLTTDTRVQPGDTVRVPERRF